jgi:hypothetical protein
VVGDPDPVGREPGEYEADWRFLNELKQELKG